MARKGGAIDINALLAEHDEVEAHNAKANEANEKARQKQEEIRAENERRRAANEKIQAQQKQQAASSGDMVELENVMFHSACFKCNTCNVKLFPRGQVGVVNGAPFCGKCLKDAFIKGKREGASAFGSAPAPEPAKPAPAPVVEKKPAPTVVEKKPEAPAPVVEKKPEPAAAAPIPKAASIADIPRSTSSISSQSLDGLSYVISGKHAKGNTFNTLTMFTVQFKQNGVDMKDVVKGDLQVVFELAGKTEKLTSSIMEGSNGALHVGCTPKVAGSFYVDFIVRGVMCNEPFMLPIKANSGTVPQHAYVGEERAKRFGAKPIGSSVTLSAPSPVVEIPKPAPVLEEEPKPESKPELVIEAKPEPVPEKDTGAASIAIEEISVIIKSVGKNGNFRDVGGEQKKYVVSATGTQASPVIDLGNGRYTFDFKINAGVNNIDLKFDDLDDSVAGFPLVISS